MSCRRYCSSPLYNRITSFTESSSCVTSFCTVSTFIIKSYRTMNVSCTMCSKISFIHICHTCVHLCVHMEFFIRKCTCTTINISDKTHINIQLQILCPEWVCCPISFGRITWCLNICIKIQNTNRNSSQNCFTCLYIISCAYKINGSCISLFVYSVFCRKAFSKLHVFKFPMVNIVKVNYSINRFDSLYCTCFKIHPINRTKRNSIKSSVCRNKLNC